MKRRDLQELAALRLKEAGFLLSGGFPEGAFYLAGYAAELALKACIARKTERYEFPDRQRVLASHTHKIADLARTAGLEDMLAEAASRDPDFRVKWTTVKAWSEASRYGKPSRAEAEALLDALGHRRRGVFRWLKHHW